MAGKQKNVKRVDTTKVQGSGSYFELRPVTVGENKAMVQMRREKQAAVRDGELTQDEFDIFANDYGTQFIIDHVVGWNWGDADGNPLPLPSADATVLDRLSTDELELLMEHVYGGGVDPKR